MSTRLVYEFKSKYLCQPPLRLPGDHYKKATKRAPKLSPATSIMAQSLTKRSSNNNKSFGLSFFPLIFWHCGM